MKTNSGFGSKYIDGRGWKYQVMPGIVENSYKARYQKAEKSGPTCWHCVRTLPWRDTAEAAQADLDAMAKEKDWAIWNG